MHKRVRVMFNTTRLLHESNYKVSDTQINCEDVVKLLGVDIDYQLNFDQHISNLCRKAGQQLNVLKKLSPFLSRLNKLTIFHTFCRVQTNTHALSVVQE